MNKPLLLDESESKSGGKYKVEAICNSKFCAKELSKAKFLSFYYLEKLYGRKKYLQAYSGH